MDLAQLVNFILGALTILAQALVLWIVFSWLFSARVPVLFARRAVLIAFLAALIATLGSLTYSDIIGYEPCKLCWFQRIFMYPQVLLLGLALSGKHKGSGALLDASLVLSIIGAAVAFYHYLLQLGVVTGLPCAAVGYSVSCAQRFVMQWGFVTIPLMSFSAFLLIAVSLLIARRRGSSDFFE